MYNAPSLANCNILDLGTMADELNQAGVQMFHIDIMDGHYVPNLCFPTNAVKDLKGRYPHILMDVHIMATNPGDYIENLSQYGADYVSFHLDSTNFSRRLLTQIREKGMKAGVVINPSQRIDALEPVIEHLDYVVLMSVEPGFAGQRFLPSSIERLEELAKMRKAKGLDFLISLDGGMDYPSIKECLKRGADIIVTGVYAVFNQPDGIISACKRFEDEMGNIKSEI